MVFVFVFFLFLEWMLFFDGTPTIVNYVQATVYQNGRTHGMLSSFLNEATLNTTAAYLFYGVLVVHFVEFIWIFLVRKDFQSVVVSSKGKKNLVRFEWSDFLLTMLFGFMYWSQLSGDKSSKKKSKRS